MARSPSVRPPERERPGRFAFPMFTSLRYRTLMVVTCIVVLPLAWVWVAGSFEPESMRAMRRGLHDAATASGAALLEGADLSDVARRRHVWLRVIRADGVVLHDHDYSKRVTVLEPVAEPFYGPEGSPDLASADAELAPLTERDEVRWAGTEPAARCEVASQGLLLVCAAAQRLPDGRVVHVMQGSLRLVRSLYEERYQLAGLTLVVLLIGGLLALWLGWRMVRPIEQLRDHVVARSRWPVSTEPVPLPRADEIGDLAQAFNALLHALETRTRSNAEFAADLAHELKNPVAAVQAAADALAADRPVEGDRRQRLHRVLEDSAARMHNVVQRFLQLARAEAGLPDAEREPVELKALVQALVERLAADQRYCDVSFEVTGPAPRLLAVPERLETAIRNVLQNAAHFSAPAGRVRVEITAQAHELAIVVDDSGPGVAEADRARVFDRYFSTREGGTGLGLPLARAIVEAHGGRIEAHTAPEGGARFVMRFARSSPTQPASHSGSEARDTAEPDGTARTIDRSP